MPKIEKYNVLLIEDEPLLLSSLKRYIEELNLGFSVVCTASNGKEGLTLLGEFNIHLVITDIIMPVMTGLEFLHYVHHHFPNVYVAILSGHANFTYAQEALCSDAIDYVLKPITKEKIENLLLNAKIKLDTQYQLLSESNLSGKTAEQILNYARNYIKEHFSESIDLNSLASQLGISSAYLTKLFNKYEKSTPNKYLTQLRISQAKHLLINSDLTIKEVGESVGYDSQFYFSRIFHKQVGLTPSEYRKKDIN